MDLSACADEDAPIVIPPGDVRVIPTGLAIAVPVGFEAQIRPRSGLASRHAVTVVNAPGTIDADYRGEVKVPLINLGREPFTVTHAMRIAQMVIAPVAHAAVTEVGAHTDLGDTARGSDGFGSTGT